MSRHLKTKVISGLKAAIDHFVPASEVSALHTRGVRYFMPIVAIDMLWGAMNDLKEGRKRRKHIIVRRLPKSSLHQLYTYHFPTHWSEACVSNRELIKEAQRQAHALEHDHSEAALEWRIRFLNHYFRVIKGGEKPEPGMKRYARFYQYTYVSIYRALKAAKEAQEQSTQAEIRQVSINLPSSTQTTPAEFSEPISFEPVEPIDVRSVQRRVLRQYFHARFP